MKYPNSKKAALRRTFRKRCRTVDVSESEWLGGLLAKRFQREIPVGRGEYVGLFASDDTEISTRSLFTRLKKRCVHVAFPRIQGDRLQFAEAKSWNQLVGGQFGIRAPFFGREVELESIHTLCVPGVAFGARGERLGRGGGFYDRLLHRYRPTRVIGLAYDFQFLADVPFDSYDQKVDAVLTDRVYRVFRRSQLNIEPWKKKLER